MSKLYKGEDYTYTNIDNTVFFDGELSAKAKGVLCQMLSFPDGWNYSIAGLTRFFKDGRDSIRSAVQELEECGYLVRKQSFADGKFNGYDYLIFANPKNNRIADSPMTENPTTEIPMTEIPTQLNTKELTTKESTTKSSSLRSEDIYGSGSGKSKKGNLHSNPSLRPTLEEVKAYIDEKGYSVDAKKFFTYFDEGEWIDGKGQPVRSWKQKIITWEQSNGKRNNFGAGGKGKGKTDRGIGDSEGEVFRFPDA